LGDLKAESANLGAIRQIEAEAGPICHVAKPTGANTDREWVMRWLLALMVLCCDPPSTTESYTLSRFVAYDPGLESDGCRDFYQRDAGTRGRTFEGSGSGSGIGLALVENS
jgi:hypothetical protein